MQNQRKENPRPSTTPGKQSFQSSHPPQESPPRHVRQPPHPTFGPHGPPRSSGPVAHGPDLEFGHRGNGAAAMEPRMGDGPPVGMMELDLCMMLAEWVERGPPLVAAVLDERNRLLHSAGRHTQALRLDLDSAQQELSRLRAENNRLRSSSERSLHEDLDACRRKLEEVKRSNNELEVRLRDSAVNKLRMEHRLTEAIEQRDAAQKRVERYEKCVNDVVERLILTDNDKKGCGKLELLGKNVSDLIKMKETEARRADRATTRANTEADRAERESKRANKEEARGREEKARADRQTEHANELMSRLIQAQNKVHDLTQNMKRNQKKMSGKDLEKALDTLTPKVLETVPQKAQEKVLREHALVLPNVDEKVKQDLVTVLKEPQFVKLFLDLIESWKASKKCLSTVLSGKGETNGENLSDNEPTLKLSRKKRSGAHKVSEVDGSEVVYVDIIEVDHNQKKKNDSEDAKNKAAAESNRQKKKRKKERKLQKHLESVASAIPVATRISKKRKCKSDMRSS